MTWEPEEATRESDGKADIDIVPYVQALNEAGIETTQSCSGHVHENGYKSDGHLWLGPDSLTPEKARELRDKGSIHGCSRRYIREECWLVTFPGMAQGEETLRRNMEDLFDVLGVKLP